MQTSSLPECLDQLVCYLNGIETRADLAVLSSLLSSPMIAADSLLPFAQFDPNTYKRNSLLSSPQFELLLLCWRPGQSSPIHNHEGSVCCVRVIQGTVTERRFKLTGSFVGDKATVQLTTSTVLNTHSVVTAYDSEIHSMTNESSSEDLISLHVYSPPLCMCTFLPDARWSLPSSNGGQ